jgi:hypothetical protein
MGCGIIITTGLTYAAFSIDNANMSRILLWQVTLLTKLAGPGPLLGYDDQGNPMYEGTPVHMFAALFGILMGVPIYSTLSFIALSLLARRKRSSLR